MYSDFEYLQGRNNLNLIFLNPIKIQKKLLITNMFMISPDLSVNDEYYTTAIELILKQKMNDTLGKITNVYIYSEYVCFLLYKFYKIPECHE